MTVPELIDALFPGAVCMDTASRPAREIIDIWEQARRQNPGRDLVCTNTDPWHLGDDPDLQTYWHQDPRRFYILTLGYHTRSVADRAFEIAFPYYWFSRDRTPGPAAQRHTGFSCLNNRPALHRLMLGHALWREGLLDQIIFSQATHNMPQGHQLNVARSVPGMQDYLDTLPRVAPGETHTNFSNDLGVDHPAYTLAWCNIVTEGEVERFDYPDSRRDVQAFTEKSYKPLRAKQVPVWFACRGHLEYLENLGIQVMRDLLPAGYDQFRTEDKIAAIVGLVRLGTDHIQQFALEHHREIQHNHECYVSDTVDQRAIKQIQQFLRHHLA